MVAGVGMTARDRLGAVLAAAVFLAIVLFLLYGIAAEVMNEPIEVPR